jgi:hypothetical protein
MYFFEQYKTCKWWIAAGIGATQLPSACRIPHMGIAMYVLLRTFCSLRLEQVWLLIQFTIQTICNSLNSGRAMKINRI